MVSLIVGGDACCFRLEEAKSAVIDSREKLERQNQQLSDYEAEMNLLKRRAELLEGDRILDKRIISRLQDSLNRARMVRTLSFCCLYFRVLYVLVIFISLVLLLFHIFHFFQHGGSPIVEDFQRNKLPKLLMYDVFSIAIFCVQLLIAMCFLKLFSLHILSNNSSQRRFLKTFIRYTISPPYTSSEE